MAALTKHVFFSCSNYTKCTPIINLATKPCVLVPVRTMGKITREKKPAQKPKKKATVGSIMDSIEAKGFLRPYKPYLPPSDVSEVVEEVCLSEGVSFSDDTQIDDLLVRFRLFAKCTERLQHSIPNSKLVDIQTIGDLKNFYLAAVRTTTPYESLQNMELPRNLHVQQDYLRFHPDTDKMFDGKTAFPQNATLVTGLKYKDKYSGHRPEKPWPLKVHSLLNND